MAAVRRRHDRAGRRRRHPQRGPRRRPRHARDARRHRGDQRRRARRARRAAHRRALHRRHARLHGRPRRARGRPRRPDRRGPRRRRRSRSTSTPGASTSSSTTTRSPRASPPTSAPDHTELGRRARQVRQARLERLAGRRHASADAGGVRARRRRARPAARAIARPRRLRLDDGPPCGSRSTSTPRCTTTGTGSPDAARRRFGIDLPYEEQLDWGITRLRPEQLHLCIEETHGDDGDPRRRALPATPSRPSARWHDAGHFIHITSHRDPRATTRPRAGCSRSGCPTTSCYCSYDKVGRCLGARRSTCSSTTAR